MPLFRQSHISRLGLVLAAFAIVATACGSGDTADTPSDLGTLPSTPAASAPDSPSGPAAPDRTFTLFEGGETNLQTFAGSPVVLNFWASWCPSCVAEMSAAFRPVQEEVGEVVTFLGMNIQDDRALALRLLEETGVQWVSAEDANGLLYTDLGGIAMPFTVFISADGEILDKHNGPLNEGQLRDRITDVFGV